METLENIANRDGLVIDSEGEELIWDLTKLPL